jgi:hypothetical protein
LYILFSPLHLFIFSCSDLRPGLPTVLVLFAV